MYLSSGRRYLVYVPTRHLILITHIRHTCHQISKACQKLPLAWWSTLVVSTREEVQRRKKVEGKKQ